MNQNFKLAAAALGGIVATVVAGCVTFAMVGHGPMGHFRGADADKNGEITRAEWLAAAGTSFDAMDANKDGKLVVGEIPPEPRGGPGHHGKHHRFDDDDRGPPPAQEADGNAVTPAPAPAQAK